jgi:HAD superfamily hydrolase (TIGR01490 family)
MVETRRAARPSLQLAPSSPPLLEAAFFDLDRTLAPGSSLFPLALEMRRRRCMTSRQLAGLACDQLIFRIRGEGNRSVSRVRDASLGGIRGWPRDWLLEIGRGVVQASLLPRMYPQGAFLVQAHRWAGREVYLATSAPEDYAMLLAEALRMDGALGTRAEVERGRYTGRLLGPLNRAEHKAERIAAHVAHRGITLERSFAYSDSISDLSMLELVGYPVAVNPDRRLREHAARRGWRILEFRPGAGRHRTTSAAEVAAGILGSTP